MSVVLVTDPFGTYDMDVVAAAFSHDLVRYKDHHVIDLRVPLATSASPITAEMLERHSAG